MQNCGMSLHTSASPTVKILVVDDYPNAADLLARSLSRLDSRLEVVAAISAYQALEYVKKGAVNILITDMDMPEMTGLELIERLQEYSQGTSIVSFLITASHTQELKIKARELNVREVFHKPVHPERICEVISRVLEEIHEAFQ
jgi:two-component system response regulator YesN